LTEAVRQAAADHNASLRLGIQVVEAGSLTEPELAGLSTARRALLHAARVRGLSLPATEAGTIPTARLLDLISRGDRSEEDPAPSQEEPAQEQPGRRSPPPLDPVQERRPQPAAPAE